MNDDALKSRRLYNIFTLSIISPMPPTISVSTGVAITNPLIAYRALLATKRIDPDPAQVSFDKFFVILLVKVSLIRIL